MFIEPNFRGERRGWIEVICGSMFSGKTEELIRRLKRAKIANLKAYEISYRHLVTNKNSIFAVQNSSLAQLVRASDC